MKKTRLLQFQSSFSLPVATASLASTTEFRIEFLVIKVSKVSIIHLGLFSFCKECMVNMDVGWYIEEKRKKVLDVRVCCSIVNIGAFLKFLSSLSRCQINECTRLALIAKFSF